MEMPNSERRVKRRSRMFDKGVTVLFVSHSLDQVKRLCNKAILLEKGQIISRGSIEEVSKVYEEKTK